MRSRSSKMTCRPRFESSMANGVPPWPLPITITSAFFTSAIPPHRLLRDLVRVILDGKASPITAGTAERAVEDCVLMSISLRALAGFATILCLWPEAAWAQTSSQVETWETQFGQQRYMEYMQRGEIVP